MKIQITLGITVEVNDNLNRSDIGLVSLDGLLSIESHPNVTILPPTKILVETVDFNVDKWNNDETGFVKWDCLMMN